MENYVKRNLSSLLDNNSDIIICFRNYPIFKLAQSTRKFNNSTEYVSGMASVDRYLKYSKHRFSYYYIPRIDRFK